MVKENDRIVLTCDVAEHALMAGDVGTVIHLYRGGEALEVEFLSLDGESLAIATLLAAQVRPVGNREITHARPLAPA
jgi:hypothetical protein